MAFLIFENHKGTKAIPIENENAGFNIGRSMDNNLRLREDSMISRHHCTIYQAESGQFVVRDLGSSNGTYINEYCLVGEEAVVQDMDQVAVGNMKFVFLTAPQVQYSLAETCTIHVNSPTPDITSPEDSLYAETARLEAVKPPKSEIGKISGKFETTPAFPHIEGFEIMNALGDSSNNHSTTYLAFQTALKRSTAIKIFDATKLNEQQKNDFLNNIRQAGRLQHPNIISYIDAGCSENHCFVSMQYAEVGNLTKKLEKGTLDEEEAVKYIIKLVEALIHSTEAGIIHYDINPNNILFNKNGDPALSDFGLAEWVASCYQLNRNFFFGSTSNMAPEQMLDKKLDWTSDQYALGTVFYEMLVGKPCFEAPSIYALIEKHMREKVRFPAGLKISNKNKDIICRMMGKTPAERFESWQALLNALRIKPKTAQDKSRKNIPLKKKKSLPGITKSKVGIQLPFKKKKKMLKK